MSFMNLTTRKALLAAILAFSAAHGALAAIPIQQWTLTNGATVSLVESHGIPMVDVELDFDGGGRRDPAGKSGLASVAASMTSKGIGAADGPALDENQLSEAWADLGASFGGGASSDRMSFTMRSLTYPDLLPRAAQLAARQLGDPTFPQAIWLRDRERFAA
jgi:zinc protease